MRIWRNCKTGEKQQQKKQKKKKTSEWETGKWEAVHESELKK